MGMRQLRPKQQRQTLIEIEILKISLERHFKGALTNINELPTYIEKELEESQAQSTVQKVDFEDEIKKYNPIIARSLRGSTQSTDMNKAVSQEIEKLVERMKIYGM